MSGRRPDRRRRRSRPSRKADRSGHVKGGCHQEPTLARLRVNHGCGEACVLVGVAGGRLQRHLGRIDAQSDQQLPGVLGLMIMVRGQRAVAAGKHDSRRRVAARQNRGLRDPLALVEDRLIARVALVALDRAAQDDDPIGRRGVGRRLGKPVLQRRDEHEADRRQSDDEERERRADRERAARTRGATAVRIAPDQRQKEQKLDRREELFEELRNDEEHLAAPERTPSGSGEGLSQRPAPPSVRLDPGEAKMTFHRDVVGAIGRTPLIRLRAASEATGCTILGKAEFMNPGGSVKDRAALAIIEDAVARGALRPGGVIVEGTAGNTGIGIAMVGGRARLPLRHRHSRHPVAGKEGHAAPCRRRTDRGARGPLLQPQQLRADIPGALPRRWRKPSPNGAVWANQFDNVANRRGHYETTGPEIFDDSTARSTGSSARSASGGTLAGVGMALKERNRDIKIALADPLGAALYSYYTTGELKSAGSSITEGIGQGRDHRQSRGRAGRLRLPDPGRGGAADRVRSRRARGPAARRIVGHQHRRRDPARARTRARPHHRDDPVRFRRPLRLEAVQSGVSALEEAAGSRLAGSARPKRPRCSWDDRTAVSRRRLSRGDRGDRAVAPIRAASSLEAHAFLSAGRRPAAAIAARCSLDDGTAIAIVNTVYDADRAPSCMFRPRRRGCPRPARGWSRGSTGICATSACAPIPRCIC